MEEKIIIGVGVVVLWSIAFFHLIYTDTDNNKN